MGVMGGLGKTLKGLVFEEDNVSSQKIPNMPAATVTDVSQQVQNSNPVSQEPIENSAAYKALVEAMLSKDTGFSRFMKSVKPLEGVIPDETQRLRAALAILNGNGLSTDEIIKAIAAHEGLIKAEKMRFDNDLKTQLAAKVETLDSECMKLEDEIKRKSEDVARIQREITEAESKKASLMSRSQTERERINGIAREFTAAHEAVARLLGEYGRKLGAARS